MDIVSLGEILIDMFPVEVGRRLLDVSAFYPKPGGACANVAVAAARLGRQSAFIGKVGSDAFGTSLIKTMDDNGVDTRGMRVDRKARTTLVFIAMPDENSAEYVFFRNPGADLCLEPGELDLELIRGAKVLHCASLLLAGEPARTAQFSAVEAARNGGALISFDVNYRPALWEDANDALEQTWRMVGLSDLLKVNEQELELLTGSRDPQAGGTELLKKGARLVAVTLGVNGSWYISPGFSGYVPPFPVETIDAIGCGDSFIASLLSSLIEIGGDLSSLEEAELIKCFTYANAAGALTATNRGVIPALPTDVQVVKFLKDSDNYR